MPCFVQVGTNGRIINLSQVLTIKTHSQYPGALIVEFATENTFLGGLHGEMFEGSEADALYRYLESNTEMFVVAE